MFTNHILALIILGVILSAVALISNLARKSYEAGPSVTQSVTSMVLMVVFVIIGVLLTKPPHLINHHYSFEILPDTTDIRYDIQPTCYDSGWINEQWMRAHDGIMPTKAEMDSLYHTIPIKHEEDDMILIPLSDPEQVEANEIEQSLYNQELNRLKPTSVNVSSITDKPPSRVVGGFINSLKQHNMIMIGYLGLFVRTDDSPVYKLLTTFDASDMHSGISVADRIGHANFKVCKAMTNNPSGIHGTQAHQYDWIGLFNPQFRLMYVPGSDESSFVELNSR